MIHGEKMCFFFIGKRKGMWVIDRVVGPAELYKQDDELQHHLIQAMTPREFCCSKIHSLLT